MEEPPQLLLIEQGAQQRASYQAQPQQQPPNKGPNRLDIIEELFKKFVTKNEEVLEETRRDLQNQGSQIRTLETQISQLCLMSLV